MKTLLATRERLKERSWLSRITAMFLMVVMVVSAVFFSLGASNAFADGPKNKDSNDELKGAMSFYSLSSSTSAFLSNTLSPDYNEVRSEKWDVITKSPANAGSMIGYADSNRNDNSFWLTSAFTQASTTMSYSAFDNDPSGKPERLAGARDYMYFGAALSSLGLDKSTSMSSLSFIPWIGGGLLWIMYALAAFLGQFFDAIVATFKVLNPFSLFYIGVNSINPTLADGMTGGNASNLPSGLKELAEYIGSWYKALYNMSWKVMVPLFFVILVSALILSSAARNQKGTWIKKYFIRISFIVLGLPLIGSMYTGTINGLASSSVDTSGAATRIVLETLVDFESWSTTNALYVPSDAVIEWDTYNQKPSDQSQIHIHDTAYAINKQTGHWAYGNKSSSGRGATIDIITRYMDNNQLSASDYETKVKSELTGYVNSDADKAKQVKNWFLGLNANAATLNDPTSTADNADTTVGENIENNAIISVAAGNGLIANADVNVISYSSRGANKCNLSSPDLGAGAPCNMAPLAIYNYLASTFSPQSLTVYSADNSTSGATRDTHMSINIVGGSLGAFLYWGEALSKLGAIVIIGYGYAVSLLIMAFRRSLEIIFSVPFATLGAIQSMAKIIIYSVALIVELIGTLFIYMLVSEFIIAVPHLLSDVFAAFYPKSSSRLSTSEAIAAAHSEAAAQAYQGPSALSGYAMSMIISLITSIVMIFFTIKALRWRHSIIKAVEEAVTKLVNKFMTSGVGAPVPGKSGAMAGLAGGAAAGLGAGLMANRMNRKDAKGKPSAAAPSGEPQNKAEMPPGATTGDDKGSAGGIAGDGDSGSNGGADGQAGQAGPDGSGTFDVDGSIDAGDVDGAGGASEGQGAYGGPGGVDDGSNGSYSGYGADGAAINERGRQVAENGLSNPEPVEAGAAAAGGTVVGAAAASDDPGEAHGSVGGTTQAADGSPSQAQESVLAEQSGTGEADVASQTRKEKRQAKKAARKEKRAEKKAEKKGRPKAKRNSVAGAALQGVVVGAVVGAASDGQSGVRAAAYTTHVSMARGTKDRKPSKKIRAPKAASVISKALAAGSTPAPAKTAATPAKATTIPMKSGGAKSVAPTRVSGGSAPVSRQTIPARQSRVSSVGSAAPQRTARQRSGVSPQRSTQSKQSQLRNTDGSIPKRKRK